MTVDHSQYFSYREKPGENGSCIICTEPTADWLAYTPPGMAAFERACCRGCVQSAFDKLRELAEDLRAVGKVAERVRRFFARK